MSHIAIICGKADSGKTYYAKRLPEIHLAHRLLVIDTMGQWDVGGLAVGRVECLKRIRALGNAQLADGAPIDFRLSCRVGHEDTDSILRALWHLQPYPYPEPDPRYFVTVVSEESDLYRWRTSSNAPMFPADQLANYGKRVANPWFLIARRVACVGIDGRANAGRIHCFTQDEPADFDALAKRRGRDVAERVRALRGHEHLVV